MRDLQERDYLLRRSHVDERIPGPLQCLYLVVATKLLGIGWISQMPLQQHWPHAVHREVVEECHVEDAACDFAFNIICRLYHRLRPARPLVVRADRLESPTILTRNLGEQLVAAARVDGAIRSPEVVQIGLGMVEQVRVTIIAILAPNSLGHPLRSVDVFDCQASAVVELNVTVLICTEI